jgi:hypothetical protein
MKTIATEIKINDVVECLTTDGWETGVIVSINDAENYATVHMHHTDTEMNFSPEFIRA